MHFYNASLLELIGNGEVLGIDIDIRKHNKKKIEEHSMYKRIHMLEGSSVSEEMVKKVRSFTEGKQTILVCLDSNHTHEHVLDELNYYAPFVTAGSYIVVFDTIVEDLPERYLPNRYWSIGNNPKTAVHEFLKNNSNFIIERRSFHITNTICIDLAKNGTFIRNHRRLNATRVNRESIPHRLIFASHHPNTTITFRNHHTLFGGGILEQNIFSCGYITKSSIQCHIHD